MIDFETKTIIENELRERYPQMETIYVQTANQSPKYGETVIYFKAIGTTGEPDFENAELDEDGNYAQKTYVITGTKDGNRLTSKIEGERESENDLDDSQEKALFD